MSITTTLTIGANVKILTANKEIDPNDYQVKNIQSPVVFLTCVGTGQTIKVHQSRICEIVNNDSNQENNMSTETVTVDDSTSTQTPKVSKPKAPKQPKEPKIPKPTPELVNFQAMIDAGQEVWTKGGLSLGTDAKVSSIPVAAHCVIGQDRTTYEIFNTYNGTRGKKGSAGKVYQFNEKLTLEKKRNELQKGGYVQFGATTISEPAQTPTPSVEEPTQSQ